MSSTCNAHLPNPRPRFVPMPGSQPWSVLPDGDHRQLRRHLDRFEGAGHPETELLAHVLRHKINTTEPVVDPCDTDIVTGGCRVTYAVNDSDARTGLLSHRARSAMASGVIPVSSLLGATLIGMRAGQRAPLLNKDGTIGTLAVLGVAQAG